MLDRYQFFGEDDEMVERKQIDTDKDIKAQQALQDAREMHSLDILAELVEARYREKLAVSHWRWIGLIAILATILPTLVATWAYRNSASDLAATEATEAAKTVTEILGRPSLPESEEGGQQNAALDRLSANSSTVELAASLAPTVASFALEMS